jgi:hypothetical protein
VWFAQPREGKVRCAERNVCKTDRIYASFVKSCVMCTRRSGTSFLRRTILRFSLAFDSCVIRGVHRASPDTQRLTRTNQPRWACQSSVGF